LTRLVSVLVSAFFAESVLGNSSISILIPGSRHDGFDCKEFSLTVKPISFPLQLRGVKTFRKLLELWRNNCST